MFDDRLWLYESNHRLMSIDYRVTTNEYELDFSLMLNRYMKCSIRKGSLLNAILTSGSRKAILMIQFIAPMKTDNHG